MTLISIATLPLMKKLASRATGLTASFISVMAALPFGQVGFNSMSVN